VKDEGLVAKDVWARGGGLKPQAQSIKNGGGGVSTHSRCFKEHLGGLIVQGEQKSRQTDNRPLEGLKECEKWAKALQGTSGRSCGAGCHRRGGQRWSTIERMRNKL